MVQARAMLDALLTKSADEGVLIRSCAAALRHLKYVQKGLAAHPFQAIQLDLAADALQRWRLLVC